jgi:hypothetical protein
MTKQLQEIQEKGFCNYCRNSLNTNQKLTESNFVDVPGKKWGDGSTAVAVYCNECLGNEQRVKQPKSAINRNTLAEVNIESLLDSKEQKELEKSKEVTAVATTPAAATTTTKKAEKSK